MNFRWQTSASITRTRVIGIIRSASAVEAVTVGRALGAAGLGVIEVSLTTPEGLRAIRELATDGDLLVGAGTVLDEAMAAAALAAGAAFLVSPGVHAGVIHTANRRGVPTIAGAATATEALNALEMGAEMIKIFPASSLGVGYLQALRPVLPGAGFVPTGGISADNARAWLAAGAVALGVGGALTTGGPEQVAEQAAALLAVVGQSADD